METNSSFSIESRLISEGDIEYFSFSNHKKQSLVPPEHMLLGNNTYILERQPIGILSLQMKANCFGYIRVN